MKNRSTGKPKAARRRGASGGLVARAYREPRLLAETERASASGRRDARARERERTKKKAGVTTASAKNEKLRRDKLFDKTGWVLGGRRKIGKIEGLIDHVLMVYTY